MHAQQKKRGPAPLDPDERRTYQVGLSLTREEFLWLQEQARRDERPAAVWARRRVLAGFDVDPELQHPAGVRRKP